MAKLFDIGDEVQGRDFEIEQYIGRLKGELGEYFTSKRQVQFKKDVEQQQPEDLSDFVDSFLEKEKKRKETEEVLNKHFEDRIIAKKEHFSHVGRKTAGVTTGYVASKNTEPDGSRFMIKIIDKDSDAYEQMAFVNEYVTAPLYKRTLYDRTPVIAGVEGFSEGRFSFRSKFLHDFQTVAEFTKGPSESDVGSGRKKFKQIEGGEKVFAAMLAWGERDIHAGNLGVMKVQDELDKEKYVLAKIDHGWSATQFFTSPAAVLENLAKAYKFYGYQDKLPLNVDKLRIALDEITIVSDDEIERLVESRLGELKKMGLDIPDLFFWQDDRHHDHDRLRPTQYSFKDYDALAKHYINNYKLQIATMRELSERLSIISKIGFSSKPKEQAKWKNGAWLKDIKGADPVFWAELHGKKIDGLGPKAWLQEIMSDKRKGGDVGKENSEIDDCYFRVLEIFHDTKFSINGLAKNADSIKDVCNYVSNLPGDDEDTENAKISFDRLEGQVDAFVEAKKQVDDSRLWKLVLKVLDSFSLLASEGLVPARIKAYQDRKNLPLEMKNDVVQSYGKKTWDLKKYRQGGVKDEENPDVLKPA